MTTDGYTNLISAQQLAALPAEKVLLIDARHSLADFAHGATAYAAGHIPNAHFLNVETDLSGEKTGTNGRHPLPDMAQFCALMNALGLHQHTQVVAYDDTAGMMAGRVWWLLRQIGFERVALLDGGIKAWVQAGFALTTELPIHSPIGHYAAHPSLNRLLIVDQVLHGISLPVAEHAMTLVDARAAERYRGDAEPIDPVGGHIPTALNACFQNNLAPDGHFKSADELRAQWLGLLGETPIHQVVHYCGSGVSACHNLLSMHIAGLNVSPNGAGLYAGSWSEWCADNTRPVAKG